MDFRTGLSRILPSAAVFLLVAASACAAADDRPEASGYRLGKGLHLGDSGIWLGGYANVEVQDLRDTSWQAQLNDLSLFVGWEHGRWRFFSEFELGDGLSAGNGRALTTHQGYFNLERLYLDFRIENACNIRVGKFLTPIGRWNQIHAAPLVWTTSSPLIVDGPFAMHTSGGMAYGNVEAFDQFWGYSIYGGGRSQFDFKSPDESSDDNYQDPIGFRLFNESPGVYQVGVSYAHFSERNFHPGVKNLLGVDAFWTRKRYELSGEFIYRFGAGVKNREFDAQEGNGNLWGLYVQGVAPLLGDIYAIARYEAFQREGAEAPGHLWLAGLAYRPMPPLVFKAEYRFADYSDKNPPAKIFGGHTEGFAASIAVLF
jgi:opacity protein-like surface antigen